MLRPRKKYTVYDLQQLKGKRCLTHIHVKSPEEAAAAEQAGVDLMSCSFDTPEAQARLPLLGAAAPHSLLSDDILGDYEERPPRHAKAYRNFLAEHRRLQEERIAAFREYIADVNEGRFPEPDHLVEMDSKLLDEVVRSLPARNTATTR